MNSKELATQLRKPEGKVGVEVGEMMFKGNATFYQKLEDFLLEYPVEHLTEVGFGLGKHIPQLFLNKRIQKYTGVDFSETLIQYAKQHFDANTCGFYLADVNEVQDLGLTTDMIFTSNTIYFSQDLHQVFSNYYNWLNNGGMLIIGRRSEEDLSIVLKEVTQHGFNNHKHADILKAAFANGFVYEKLLSLKEKPRITQLGRYELHANFYVFRKS